MAKFCRHCGSPLHAGAKFCQECGKNVIIDQRQTTPVVKETTETGQTVSGLPSGPPPVQPPNPAPVRSAEPVQMNPQPAAQNHPAPVPVTVTAAPPQNGHTQTKNAGKRGGVFAVALVLAAAFLFTAFGYPGFLRDGTDGDSSKTFSLRSSTQSSQSTEKVLKTERAAVSQANPAVTLCGVTVDVEPGMLTDGNMQIAVSKMEDGVTDDGDKCEKYDIDVGTHDTLPVPVKVTFPCRMTEGYDPVVSHYNMETGEWDSLFSFVDETNGTVSAYFSSFSGAEVSYLPIGVNPKIYYIHTDKKNPYYQTIGIAKNSWNILQRINPASYSDEVIKFKDDPENYAIKIPELDPDMDSKMAYDAFMESNTLWGFCDPVINMGIETLPYTSQKRVVQFMIDHSGELGNAMNAIPFVIMGAQLAHDLSQKERDALPTAAMNLYKNMITSSGTIYSLTSGFSHIGFSLAFLGVSLFGMELDYFIDAAKAEQAENIKAVFNAYYTETKPFDAYHWYTVFYNAYWENDGDPDKAMKAVRDAVDEYCNEFWKLYDQNGDELEFVVADANYKKVFRHASADLRKSLVEQQKQQVWDLIEKHSMKIIQRFLIDRIREKSVKQLNAVIEPYNKELTFTIKETVIGTGEAAMTGKTICFGIDNQQIPGWHRTIPDSKEFAKGWTTDYVCTVLGYLKMGMPNALFIYNDEEDFLRGEKPDEIRTFEPELNGSRNTVIEFVTDNGPEAKSNSFTGYTWDLVDHGRYSIHDGVVSDAMTDALRKMTFQLDQNGNFSATSSGSNQLNEHDDYDDFRTSASASVSVKGSINKKTGDGTYEMTATVTYHYTYSNDYMGTDNHNLTIKYQSSGEIRSDLNADLTFDPVFSGEGTIKVTGNHTHKKGRSAYDEDSSDSDNFEKDTYFEMTFIANN